MHDSMSGLDNLDSPGLLRAALDLEGTAFLPGKEEITVSRPELFAIVSAAVNAVLDERKAKRTASSGGFDIVRFINERYGGPR